MGGKFSQSAADSGLWLFLYPVFGRFAHTRLFWTYIASLLFWRLLGFGVNVRPNQTHVREQPDTGYQKSQRQESAADWLNFYGWKLE